MNKQARVCVDRFYFLGDWEDEYCDLTLDKMLSTIRAKSGVDASRKVYTPTTLDDLKEYIELHSKNSSFTTISSVTMKPLNNESSSKPKSFFEKVRTFFNLNK